MKRTSSSPSVILSLSKDQFISGGPATPRVRVLSGWSRESGTTGSDPQVVRQNIASCALRTPGQRVVRATRRNLTHFLLFSLFLLGAPIVARAQTNAPADASAIDTTPASAPTNAPDLGPALPQFNPQSGPGQAMPKQEDIDDIRPPFFFLHSSLWLWIALAAAALVALLLLLWNWLKKRSVLNPKTAYDLALEKLEKARALLQEDNPVPYAVSVSEIIRTYLGQRFQNPSTRRTTEEFLRQMESDPSTPLAAHRELLRDFLQACDMVKFARYQPTLAELEQVQERAVSFVTATKPVPAPTKPQRTGRLTPVTP